MLCPAPALALSSHTEAGMPTRRTFEMVVLTVVLAQPALAMIRLWLRKHVVTTGTGAAADAARAGIQIL